MAGEAENESASGGITWASAGLNLSNIFMRAAKNLRWKLSPAFVRTGGHFGNAASLGAVAYEVYREDGLKHKSERAAAGLVSTGVNMALGSAAATAAESAALTGLAGATSAAVITGAAPVVLSVAAAAATAKVAALSIENRRAYEDFDRDVARGAGVDKIRNRDDAGKPSILDYKHMAAMLGVTAHMRDEALHTGAPVERFAGSLRMRNLGALDMTDAANLAEYERALKEEIDRQRNILEANDSLLPRWLRHGDAVEKYNFAAGELQNLQGAKDELALFKQDVQRYHERPMQDERANNVPSSVTAQHTAPNSLRNTSSGFNHAVASASGTPAPSDAPEQLAGMQTRPVRPMTPA